jgi:hypothetical protein
VFGSGDIDGERVEDDGLWSSSSSVISAITPSTNQSSRPHAVIHVFGSGDIDGERVEDDGLWSSSFPPYVLSVHFNDQPIFFHFRILDSLFTFYKFHANA